MLDRMKSDPSGKSCNYYYKPFGVVVTIMYNRVEEVMHGARLYTKK